MPDKKEYKEFRELLRAGIGSRSQTEFAEEIGIDVATLNRMLNNEFIARPRKNTLKKIAEHIKNATLGDLYMACDYTDAAVEGGWKDAETAHERRIMKSIAERRELNVKDLMSGFEACRNTMQFFNNFDDIIDFIRSIYSVEDIDFTFGKEYKTEKYNADCYRIVKATWHFDRGQNCFDNDTYCVVFYSVTRSGKMIVIHAAFDGETVSSFACNDISKSVKDRLGNYGVDLASLPFISISHLSQEETAEARLLRAIFGSGDTVVVPTYVSGFGFYLHDEAKPHRLLAFFKNHLDSCSKIFRPIVEKVLNGEAEALTAFEDVYNLRSECGYGAAIADIIDNEMTYNVVWKRHNENSDNYFNRSCVFIPYDEYDGKSEDEIQRKMYDYAKELGLRQVERCVFQTEHNLEREEEQIVIEY